MKVTREEFGDFFAAVRGGQRPFAWQERLLDHLLAAGRWPDRVVAPTGAGKTAVIDVHVFANALRGSGLAPRVPRRLAMVVDRRVVVDSHDLHAQRIADLLRTPSGVEILRRVSEALATLQVERAERTPLVTARLRGGSPPPRSWLDTPDACAVLSCTPDMWGSRLLLQGYGSSRRAWPREAGMLAVDAAVVVDEAHLSRQLLLTARRIAALQTVGVQLPAAPVLQVVETTATPDAAPGTEVGVAESDLARDEGLAARLSSPKPVRLLPLGAWPIPSAGPDRTRGVSTIADAAEELLRDCGSTVGCVLNRVATAIAVAAELRRRGRVVELLVGRLRPADVTRLRRRRPSLLTVEGDPAVEILVATQTVEVGIDLDLHGLVTDLAPGTALAQRAGRVNRLGLRPSGPVVVVAPVGALPEKGLEPYSTPEIEDSLTWVRRRAADPDGFAPWSIRTDPPPGQQQRRTLYQRPELADSWQWARTSGSPFAEPDLDLWLADDLDADLDVGVVARILPDHDVEDWVALVDLIPPAPREVLPVRISLARELVLRLRTEDTPLLLIRAGQAPRVLETEAERAAGAEAGAGGRPGLPATVDLRPGDIVIVPDGTPMLAEGVATAVGSEPITDVLEIGVAQPARAGQASLRVGRGALLAADGDSARARAVAAVLEAADVDGGGPLTLDERHAVAASLERLRAAVADAGVEAEQLEAALATAAALLRRGSAKDADVELQLGDDDELTGIVVVDRRRARADEDVRQTWTNAPGPVPLEDHQAAVAERAAAMGSRLDLDAELVGALEQAGRHHDDGKADRRFQQLLRAHDADEAASVVPLAKSGRRSVSREREARARAGLPGGWRHEQLSALRVWMDAAVSSDDVGPLVTRLVGTTHGHGRPGFPHASHVLLPADCTAGEKAAAVELFDVGVWDEIVEKTDGMRGVWVMAYLEAILRAADGQVSGEGS